MSAIVCLKLFEASYQCGDHPNRAGQMKSKKSLHLLIRKHLLSHDPKAEKLVNDSQ